MGDPSVAFVQQYKNTITMLVQQMTSRFRDCVMIDTDFQGNKKFYDQYSTDSMVEIMTRYADTPVQTPNHQRRMITPRYFVSSTLEDPADALQMVVDPKSAYMQAKQAAAARQFDDLIISAHGGTAYSGQGGGTSETFDSANTIAVDFGGSTVGMTKAKLLKSSRLFNAAEVEKEDRYLAQSARQLEDLLNTTEVASGDYNVVKALVEGTLDRWIGFKFVHSERLSTSSGDRICLAWQKKGLQAAMMKDNDSRISERPDKNYAMQVYLRLVMGATRLEEERCVQILCDET